MKDEQGKYGLGYQEKFVRDMELFQSAFSNWRVWTVVVLLSTLYFIDSKYHGYYDCTPIITWATLSFYYDDNIGDWSYWFLLVLTLAMSGLFCHTIYKLKLMQMGEHEDNESMPSYKPLLELGHTNDLFTSHISEEMESNYSETGYSQEAMIEVEYNVVPDPSRLSKGTLFFSYHSNFSFFVKKCILI